ncbi:MAG TPA: prephenate dehydrogenase/arogenate dehydrogenase family protein [Acidimicrobiales bacterium]
MTSPTEPRRAGIVGTGLIGGSIGMALRARGWHVSGFDRDPDRAARAVALGALDEVGPMAGAEVVFVATPVGAITGAATAALAGAGPGGAGEAGPVVTDVGSVKASVVDAIGHPRFVGGHPMAGSEQEGVEGADAELFAGATWVLTPTAATDPGAYARVHAVVSSFGADVVAVAPERHDALVAMVSHVPHLTAAALMELAAADAEEHVALLRMAAGGFRDMTRVAAGHPGIWPDICAENAGAILATLDRLVGRLSAVREVVARADRGALLEMLESARTARRNLPARAALRAEELVEVRVPVPDREGVLAEVTTLAAELGVNIWDLEIAHSAEGDRGVLLMVVDAAAADLVRGALLARGYRPSVQPL